MHDGRRGSQWPCLFSLDLTALIFLWSLSQVDFGGCAAAEVILAAPQKAGQRQDPSLHRTCPVFNAAVKANQSEENTAMFPKPCAIAIMCSSHSILDKFSCNREALS